MSEDNEPLDMPAGDADQEREEQTLIEQKFKLPGEDQPEERIKAIREAISKTEIQLNRVADGNNKERARYGRHLQKLKRMLHAAQNPGQTPDDQITVAAPDDLQPVPAKVSIDDEDIKVEAPQPDAWKENNGEQETAAAGGGWTAGHAPTRKISNADGKTDTTTQEKAEIGPTKNQAEAEPKAEDADEEWENDATLQMDAPAMPTATDTDGDDDWQDDATLQMDIGQSSVTQLQTTDWDGTEATMQMDTGNAEWDGTEATMQMGTDGGEWDGSEVTLQNMPTGQGDTQATFVPKKDSDTDTNATILTDSDKPRTRGGTSKGMEAGWHLKGRKGPATGETWGDYEIGGVLGEGGMGLVYRARQASLNRKCAVKVLAPHLAADDKVRERFELEAQTTSLLVSPNIVNVFAAGVSGENNYFVMEYVDGEDLADKIKERGREGQYFSCDEAADIIIQAARGLSEAARHHIVHRDIKPGNLMVTNKGEVKIADFGIVKVMGESSLTMTGQAVGTPSYLSPEQGRGDEVDVRSDLYSLGVVFYQLITGQRPFDGSTPNALIYQHNFEEPKMPKELVPSITDDIQAVVIKLLAKKPENRYQKADDLVRDLEAILEGNRLEALLAEKLSTGADEARKENLSWAQRNLLNIVVAVAALLLVTVGYIYYEIKTSSESDKRLTRLNDQRSSLSAILDAERPIPEVTPDDLTRFAEFIQSNSDIATDDDRESIVRWNKKINRTRALRNELTVLDNEFEDKLVTCEIRAAAVASLGELRSLIGSEANDVQRWDAKLQETSDFITRKKSELAVIDRTPKESMQLTDRQAWQRDIDILLPLVQDSTTPDAELDGWLRKLRAFDSFHEQNLAKLSAIKDKESLSRPEILTARLEHRQLQTTLGAQNETVVTYGTILNLAEEHLQRLEAALRRLGPNNSEPLTVAEHTSLSGKLEEIKNLQAIDVESEQRYSKRLAREAAYRDTLRQQLSVVDQPQNFDHLYDKISTFARVVGGDDPDARRWVAKRNQVEDLRVTLQHLNEAVPLQEDATANLKQLAQLIGSEDQDVFRWSQKIDRVNRLAAELKVLDETRIIPNNAARALDLLAADIGEEDPRIARWRSKINRVTTLKMSMQQMGKQIVLPVRELQQRHAEFKELVNNVGMNDPDLKAWARHLAVLNGPGKPAWAQAHGRDNFGIWAELHILPDGSLPPDTDTDSIYDEDAIIKVRFRFVPAGTFVLGASTTDAYQEADENQITCSLTNSYWIADTETTQDFYQAVMQENPSLFKNPRNPVERLSWHMAKTLITRLKERVPEFPVRMPSESEWERACKAGYNEAIIPGPLGPVDISQINDIAWYQNNAERSTHNVGVRQPNSLGLHDTLGNVWEWCRDGYNSYPTLDAIDFVGTGERKVARGGSWGDSLEKIRASNRLAVKSNMRSAYLGLRLAADVEWPQQSEPGGERVLAAANESFEQIKIEETLASNVRVFFQMEWPKAVSKEDARSEEKQLIIDAVGEEHTSDSYETSTQKDAADTETTDDDSGQKQQQDKTSPEAADESQQNEATDSTELGEEPEQSSGVEATASQSAAATEKEGLAEANDAAEESAALESTDEANSEAGSDVEAAPAQPASEPIEPAPEVDGPVKLVPEPKGDTTAKDKPSKAIRRMLYQHLRQPQEDNSTDELEDARDDADTR